MREEKRYHPLAVVRERHNLTQKRLAEVVRIGERTVTRAENNKPIGTESRRRLCEYFDMTAEQLGLKGESGDSTEPQTTKEEREVRTDVEREHINEQQDASLHLLSSSSSPDLIPAGAGISQAGESTQFKLASYILESVVFPTQYRPMRMCWPLPGQHSIPAVPN